MVITTTATAQGSRSHQEDRAVCKRLELPSGSGWVLAIFDGHRGAATADEASRTLLSLFRDHFTAQRGDPQKTLRGVFASLNKMTERHTSGSTASIVFIPQDAGAVYLGVLGDSPVAILDAAGKAHIGPDHNIRTNLRERAAAETRGGAYVGGYLEDAQTPGVGLQMTRSLGDAKLARVLEREPEIEKILLGGKGIVLVGSDGLLLQGDEPNAVQLKRLLHMIREGVDAAQVVADAEARMTGDNVTAVVWRKD